MYLNGLLGESERACQLAKEAFDGEFVIIYYFANLN